MVGFRDDVGFGLTFALFSLKLHYVSIRGLIGLQYSIREYRKEIPKNRQFFARVYIRIHKRISSRKWPSWTEPHTDARQECSHLQTVISETHVHSWGHSKYSTCDERQNIHLVCTQS